MTTKPKAQKFRIRRSSTAANPATTPSPSDPAHAPAAAPEAAAGQLGSAQTVAAETNLDAIRQEGLTGRQLRMARRVAQKNGLAVTSDFDAVRQLRERGIDPFQRGNVLELVAPDGQGAAEQMRVATAKVPADQVRVQLPQTVQKGQKIPSTQLGNAEDSTARRFAEISEIQKDIARRRQRNLIMLFSRMAMFIFLPTLIIGYYYYNIATPMYATESKFVIQQAESQGGGGFGSLFQGTGLANQTDSTNVQSYVTSRSAFMRLDEDHGFIEHFSSDDVDPIQRLAPDATVEAAYALFKDNVQIGYDATEGFLRMEVIAADPHKSEEFALALIGYAEEQVDQLTQRVRADQMAGAEANLAQAAQRRADALAALVAVQQSTQAGGIGAETAALQQRITNLQVQLDDERLNLAALLNNRRPNEAQVNGVQSSIKILEDQVTILRNQLSGSGTIVANDASLRLAEENYAFEVTNVQAAQASLDSARVEANRQVRYLSISVPPIAPDQASYPRKFENTLLAFLILSGIYLMISLTASILREQVSS